MNALKAKKNKQIFKALTDHEKLERLSMVAKNKQDVQIWENSSNFREFLVATEFDPKNFRLHMTLDGEESKLLGKSVLINFDHEGHEFFSTGILQVHKEKTDLYSIKFDNKIFRFDKRKDIRIPSEYTRHMSFRMNRMDGFSFKCANLSVGGVAIIVPEEKLDIFPLKRKFMNVVVELDGESYAVHSAMVLHVTNYRPNIRNEKQIGIVFKGVSERIRGQLKDHIQSLLYNAIKAEAKS